MKINLDFKSPVLLVLFYGLFCYCVGIFTAYAIYLIH